MPPESSELVLPRPGGAPISSKSPISGPSEAAFTETFGTLLPPAKYLKTAKGKVAYYEITPSSPGNASQIPDRVLFVHGIQTPALGLLPLAGALHGSFPSSHFVLVDLWGHGLSDTPIVAHEPSLFHELLDDLLDHLQWSSVHLVGYSFGGALTIGYVVSRSTRVKSFTLIAPAGLICSTNFPPEQRAYLHSGDEVAARKWVLNVLEGGELVVPVDWKERVGRGEVVAQAVKEWQIRQHPGHMASVVAIFRDGGVVDNSALFAKAARTGIPSLVVLGELDDVCSKQELNGLGFADVHVIAQVGHGVSRERPVEVAAFISDFWSKLD